MGATLIADSGSTKTSWTLTEPGKRKKNITTQGLSPYFLSSHQVKEILEKELHPKLKLQPSDLFFYGTGCGNPANVKMLTTTFKSAFPKTKVKVESDILAAARALCGNDKGMVCILGTGSSVCYYDGKKIAKSSPGLGFILGDEGSGAYLGRKVVQYYLYNTFEPDLMDRFRARFPVSPTDILDAVYRQQLPNRYLARFTEFLAENRGHFMIENIIEDGLNDFFFNHVYKFRESWTHPVHFVGSVAFGFKDILENLCQSYELLLGNVLKSPMDGLVKYHS